MDSSSGDLFNDSNFSDRVLKIEIMASSDVENESGSEGVAIKKDSEDVTCTSPSGWARNSKRRKIDTNKAKEDSLEHVLNVDDNVPDFDDVALDNQDGEAIHRQLHSGGEDVPNNDSSRSMDGSTVLRVTTVHVSSAMLAAKSPFFYKLFSNGMRESGQRCVTIQINASEEAALMDLLKFMYSNTISVTTAAGLLDVLMAADKFEVASCMRYCSQLLSNLPMTPDSASLYLELASSVLKADVVQPLVDAAKQYFASRYKDLTEFSEELLNLPLAGIEAVLSRDDLQVVSEDAVYDFVLKWAELHYSKIEDRRKVLGSCLSLIRFPFMTCQKLEQVLTCNDFDHEHRSKFVLEAFRFKAESPYRLASKESAVKTFYVERAYKLRPVKVIGFELPRQQCLVYLDLKRDECENLFPSGRVLSQEFSLGGQGFCLLGQCIIDQQSSSHCFGLFVGMIDRGLGTSSIHCKLAARSKPSEEFLTKFERDCILTVQKNMCGSQNLFAITWTNFMAENSRYFINGILHLRAELTIKN